MPIRLSNNLIVHAEGLKVYPSMKIFLTKGVQIKPMCAMIDPMKILNGLHINLAKAVLEIERDDDLAKRLGIGVQTLKRMKVKNPDREVLLDTRVKARNSLDSVLSEKGYEFTPTGGIDRIKEKEA